MTPDDWQELAELLKGTCAHLCEYEGGYIVEFDNGEGFAGVMHPQAALEMLRGSDDGRR